MPDDIVYSAGSDPEFPSAKASEDRPATSAPNPGKPKQAEAVRISFRRGCKGSGMTVITRLQMHPAGKEELLKAFKKKLGVGGAVKLGELQLQGGHLDAVETRLKELGYKVKRLQ